MSVSLTFAQTATAQETLAQNTTGLNASSRVVTWSAFNKTASLTASTTPPVTKVAGGTVALSGGAKTIDLTALTSLGANGYTEDMTGLKVQSFYFENPSTNANVISATFGASNPYNLSGADWKLTLSPGQSILLYGNDATPDVAAGAKNIDFAGTAVQPFKIQIVAG